MNNEEFDYTDSQMLRKKAEKALKAIKKKADQKTLDSDQKKLIHELQVQQIELEMQNEELLLAYEAAEKALKKYTLLYDFAPMGYLTIGMDGTILDLNIAASEMIGEKRGMLKDANLRQFIVNESEPIFNAFLEQVFTSDFKQSCAVLLGNGDNLLVRVYMEGVFIPEDNSGILSFLDVSGLNQAVKR
jgi:PAS domain-containing protein